MCSPRLNAPLRFASSSAIATAAAEVLPYLSRLTKTRSLGTARRSAMASMIRRFAWCGMTQAMSSGLRSARSMTFSAASFMRLTACLKTSLPIIVRVKRWSLTFSLVIGQALPPPGMLSRWVRFPSVPISVARIEPSSGSARRSTAAPAPSPKSTQVVRSSQLVTDESFSAPMISAFLKAPSEIRRLEIFIA